MLLWNQVTRLLSALSLTTCLSLAADAANWELLPQECHDVELTQPPRDPGRSIQIITTGPDPYLIGRWVGDRHPNDRVLSFQYFCTDEIRSPSVMFGPPFVAKNELKLPSLAIAEGWTPYHVDLKRLVDSEVMPEEEKLRIDLGRRSGIRIQLRDVRLRPKSAAEIREDAARQETRRKKLETADQLQQYLASSFTTAINSVSVLPDEIRIRCDLSPSADGFQLREYAAQHSVSDVGIVVDEPFISGERFSHIQLPRFVDGRDRLHSSWRIADANGQFLSPRCFATEIASLHDDAPRSRAIPANKKGMTSVSQRGPLEELPELGITAITVNVLINRFIVNQPGHGRVRIETQGDSIYFDPGPFKSYDRIIDFARRHNIVVTAIVLIPSASVGTKQTSPLVHPDSDGGKYAMPDITSARGAGAYAYVLDAIASRYRSHERSPGAITNWIAHNEVDYHPVWTNMGDQPRPVVAETYYRSMRMIHNAARQHNPHARVFASLTHHWVVRDDGSRHKSWQRLAPRELLRSLQTYSAMEGDFDWGVAYHPYPQSLFAADAWSDQQPTNDVNTPMITIQNLDLLDRFMHRPDMRTAAGDVRPVLLSEQGFHTKSYDQAAQDRQAGSLWYAMQKVDKMPSVESFHYHRWIDHPNEGGLMLGLRTLPTREHRYGERKKSWYVYQAIGTDREESVTNDLPGP